MTNDTLNNSADRLHQEMEWLFYDFFHSGSRRILLPDGRWLPPVDIYEADSRLVIKADLAGVNKEEISVVLKGRELCIRGIRRRSSESSSTYHQMEIDYGEFERTVMLSEDVDEHAVGAEYRDGFLYVIIQKD